MKTVSPKFALIGVGKDNTFGHPNEEIIERINDNGIILFRTDTDGEISIVVNRNGEMNRVKKFINK